MAGNQESFHKAMNSGHSAAWDQDWQKAAGYYSAAMDEFPDNPLALSSLGLAYFEMQDYENSSICYQHAARVAPKDPVPQEKLARIYERMGKLSEATDAYLKAAELHLNARDVEKAIDNWQRVLAILPEQLPTRQRLAAVFERIGRKAEAVSEYIATASILQRNGDLTRALRAVEYATRLMPESQDARFALHTLRSSQMLPRPGKPKNIQLETPRKLAEAGSAGVPAEGEPSARQNNPLDEARQRAKVTLAGLLFDQAEETGVTEHPVRRGLNSITRGSTGPLGKSTASKTSIILHLGQAIESLTNGDEAQASKELEKALDLGLRQPAAYYILGLLTHTRDPERAQRFLQEAKHHPDFALAACLLNGQIYRASGMNAEAASAYLQALSLADAEMVGEPFADELRQSYEPMIDALGSETDPVVLQSICTTISTQLDRADWRSFLRMARSQLPQVPDQPPLPVAEMILESRSGQVVEAVARVRDLARRGLVRTSMEEAFYAIQFAPTYLPIHVQVGELLLQEGHNDEAVKKFLAVAELYNARGETTRSSRMLKRILQISPMDLVVRDRLIQLLVAQQKIEEALEEYMELADIYYRLAELEKARQTFMTALKMAQQSRNNRTWGVEILLKVADIDLQRLNLRQAVRIYEQIRTLQPDDPTIRSQMVLLNFRLGQDAAALNEVDSFIHLLENNGRRRQAIDFVNDLLVEQGSNLDLRRRLADLYAREGRTPEAVAQLDAVAEAYMDTGKMMEAINMMETIIALKPANVEDYKKALEELRRNSLRR
jgi:tetratricopeptide (TPR) repeat protein